LASKATTEVKVTNSVECRDDDHFHRSGKFSIETKLSPTFSLQVLLQNIEKSRKAPSICLKNADHAPRGESKPERCSGK